MKIWILAIAMLLALSGSAFADLEINQVLVDSSGSDSGGEFIQLKNAGSESINLTGYTLKTETSNKDATLPDYLLTAGEFYLVTDTAWDTEKQVPGWPDADYKEDVTFKNTNDGVALVYNGSIVDAVGWGVVSEIEDGLYEGTPVAGISEGFSLQRTQDTNNNADDFELAEVSFSYNTGVGEDINVGFSITNTLPEIINVTIEDFLEDEGVQVLPLPGGQREVGIEIFANDSDGDNLTYSVLVNGESYELDSNTGTFLMDYSSAAGNWDLEVVVSDGSESVNLTTSFEYLEMIAIGIDTTNLSFGAVDAGGNVSVQGDLDLSTETKPTVQNIGNVGVDIGLSGTNFVDGSKEVGITSLHYNLGTVQGNLSTGLQVAGIDLESGAVVDLGFELNLPQAISKGNYEGSVSVVGVAA
jgi:hypothetical protein